MILRVILKNFLSFNEEAQFDMFPNMKRTSLSKHINVFEDKVAVLKMAAIYGSNGAGKSNLLKGLNFLKELATDKTFLDKESVGKYFFGLKKDAGIQPLELTVEFITKGGVPYVYSVEITRGGIKFETLQVSGLGKSDNINVFTRDGKNVKYAKTPSEEISRMVTVWLEKNPFASLLTINNDVPILTDENINNGQKWFEDELEIIGLHSFTPALIDIFKNKLRVRKFASQLFKAIDLGIDDVKVETENVEDYINTHNASMLPIDKVKKMRSGRMSQIVNFRNTSIISIEKGVQKISQMMFEQFGKDGFSKEMDIQAQSDGTVRLLSLVPAFYDAMKVGKTVVIDELDHSIHPHLVRELVRYFSSQKTKGQLIFTTHQTCLLNQNFIRTDEVWFVEKKDGGSHMYSLNDFKIHNTINIENGYLEGRYGAIPFIGDLNM
ncbi:AAA family ATPase [Prevotella sp.]|uniref:AAA family ATPase n=1 Tax=Prevotella sp. TaxID=59823 RepID=UPI002647AF2B|nr:ATP-binding protein [Prevotella sp.]MDN5554788.1 ATP-binding protein [Prevotella sp.]